MPKVFLYSLSIQQKRTWLELFCIYLILYLLLLFISSFNLIVLRSKINCTPYIGACRANAVSSSPNSWLVGSRVAHWFTCGSLVRVWLAGSCCGSMVRVGSQIRLRIVDFFARMTSLRPVKIVHNFTN